MTPEPATTPDPVPAPRSRRHDLLFLLLILVVFLAIRAGVLWKSNFILCGSEETINGVLPLHMLRGSMLPWLDYRGEEYAGGTLVVGAMAYPLFAWLGPRYLALKLVALVFSVALMVVTFFFTRRFFGSGAARWAAVLMTLPPAFFLERSLMTLGTHLEVTVFLVAALWLFAAARIASAEVTPRGRLARLAAMGVVAGFATFFDYEFVIIMPVLVAAEILDGRRWRDTALNLLMLVLGFRLGFVPWYLTHGGASFSRYVFGGFFGRFGVTEHTYDWHRVGDFFLVVARDLATWMQSAPIDFAGFHWADAAEVNHFFLAVFVAAYFYLVVRARHAIVDFARNLRFWRRTPIRWRAEHLLVLLIAYVPAHLAVYALVAVDYDPALPAPHRYLHPVFFVFFVSIALLLDELWRRRAWVGLIGLALPLVAFGAWSPVGLTAGATPGLAWRQPGYSYLFFYGLAQTPLGMHSADSQNMMNVARAEFPGHEEPFYEGVIVGAAYLRGLDMSRHLPPFAQYGRADKAALVAGFGAAKAILDASPSAPVSVWDTKPTAGPRTDPERAAALDSLFGPEFHDALIRGEALGPLLIAD